MHVCHARVLGWWKPVGTRFVQMVSKNSRMGNSFGICAYHLHNLFTFTERVWREAISLGNEKTYSVPEIL